MNKHPIIKGITKLFIQPKAQRDTALQTIITKLSNMNTAISGIKSAITLSQQGERFKGLEAHILHASKINSQEFQLLAVHYLANFSSVEEEHTQAIEQAFMSNISKTNPTLKRSILLEILPRLPHDRIIVYLYDLKEASVDEDIRVRRSIPSALCRIEKKCPNFILSEGLSTVLVRLTWDDDLTVQAEALDCIRKTKTNRIISADELCELLLDFQRQGYSHGITTALSLLESSSFPTGDSSAIISTLYQLLLSTDASVFYCASRLLYELEPSSVSTILDHACGFMNMRHEQLYNMLALINTFLEEYIEMLPRSEMITLYHSDPDYIARMKLKILAKLPDGPSCRKVSGALKGIWRKAAIEECAEQGRITEEIIGTLKPEEEAVLLKLLVRSEKQVSSREIRRFLGAWAGDASTSNYLDAVARYCSEIPAQILRLDKKKHGKRLFRFYCCMMHRYLHELLEEIKILTEARNYSFKIAELLKYFHGFTRMDEYLVLGTGN